MCTFLSAERMMADIMVLWGIANIECGSKFVYFLHYYELQYIVQCDMSKIIAPL